MYLSLTFHSENQEKKVIVTNGLNSVVHDHAWCPSLRYFSFLGSCLWHYACSIIYAATKYLQNIVDTEGKAGTGGLAATRFSGICQPVLTKPIQLL